MHTNPFNRRTSYIVRWVTLMPDLGGLKGEMAPGDAHPYLALFHFQKLSAVTRACNMFSSAFLWRGIHCGILILIL
jgi:hypothetical protein